MIRHRACTSARLALCVCAISLGGVPRARAAEVLVWPARPGTPVAEAEAAVRAAGHRVVDSAPLRARLQAEAEAREARTREAAAALDAALQTARRAYLEQRYDAMLAALVAVELDGARLPGALCRSGLWDLEFQLGLAYQQRAQAGDDARARARYALAFAIDAARRPETALYGPDVAFAFVRAIEAVGARAARPVQLDVRPADATVTVDCTPWSASAGVRPGLHAVAIEAPGFVSEVRVIEVEAEAVIASELQVEAEAPLGAAWVAGNLSLETASTRAAIARAAGVPWVLWFEVEGATRSARLLERGELRGSARGEDTRAVVDEVLTALGSAKKAAPARRTKLWVGLAGAALGSLALGLGLGLGLDHDRSGQRLQLVVR